MKGDVEGLPLHLQLPPALRQGRTGDPMAILRPGLKNLELLESTRVLSAVDDAIWRADVITAIDQISRNVKVMAAFLGSTLVGLVERHQQVVGTLGDLKSRSEIIKKLTSFQLMEACYRGPMLSYQSINMSRLDLTSLQSSDFEVPIEEVPSEDWQNVPWGQKRIELEPSIDQSSTGTIAQIKRRMRDEEAEARRGYVLKAEDSDDEDDDMLMSLRSSKSRINLMESGGSSEEEEEEKTKNLSDPLIEVIESPKVEYVQNIQEIASLEALMSQQSQDGGSGDSLNRVISLPWASIQDYGGSSIHTQIDERLKAKAVRMSLRLVQDQLTMLVRNILRAFRLNPTAIERILADKQRTDPSQEFVVLLKDLRQLMLQRLLTTPAEEKAKTEYKTEVERRTEGYDKLRQRLADEIEKVNRDRENKCREMNDMLRKLQLDIMTVEKLAEEYMQRTRQEGEKLRQAELKLSQERRQKPLLEQSDIAARLAKLREEHWASETVLRRKKYKVETEIENWIKRFDEDMTALQTEFDDVEAAYDVEKAAMEEMEDRFEPMEVAFKEILEEREKLHRVRMVTEREDVRRLRAARAIQAWWRSYRVRKTIRIRNQKLEKQRLRELKKKGKKGKRGKKAKGAGEGKEKEDKKGEGKKKEVKKGKGKK